MTSIDLTNCDREQIHHISYVQGHGAFLAVSPLDLKIHHASENISAFFGQTEDVHYFIGRKLQDLITKDLALEIQERLRTKTLGTLKHHEFDIFLFELRDNVFGVEFEKNIPTSQLQPTEEILNQFIQKMHQSETLEDLSHEACRAVRRLTGMDRVMLYRFYPPTMYGQVIGEDRTAESHAFMGHRFPATDIPKPARDLYLKNEVRFIYDSASKDFEVFPKTGGKSVPLDMSDSRLRGVSRIHLEYLKNMGVRTSLSFAIIVEDRLWGLIACHHSSPISVSHTIRSLGNTVASAYAMGASLIEKISGQGHELNFFNRLHDLFASINLSEKPLTQLFREGVQVMKLFECTGMAMVSSERVDFFGVTPLPEDLHKIHKTVIQQLDKSNKNVFVTENLSQLNPELAAFKEQVCGVLAVRISEVSDKLFMVMRPEYLETIQWGGDPRKNFEARNYGGDINPRKSFETWTEVVSNTSKPWKKFEVKGIESFRNLIFDALINKEELIHELQKKLSRN